MSLKKVHDDQPNKFEFSAENLKKVEDIEGGKGFVGNWRRFQNRFVTRMDQFVMKIYKPSLRWCLEWRYLTMSIATAVFFITMGLVGGGHLKFTFFPPVGRRRQLWNKSLKGSRPHTQGAQEKQNICSPFRKHVIILWLSYHLMAFENMLFHRFWQARAGPGPRPDPAALG